jgi:hypothetical protein
MPTHVEGLMHGVDVDLAGVRIAAVDVGVRYWDGATEKSKLIATATLKKVLANGGSEADWDALVAMAADGSPTDDLVEEMVGKAWGQGLLWGCWYRTLRQ